MIHRIKVPTININIIMKFITKISIKVIATRARIREIIAIKRVKTKALLPNKLTRRNKMHKKKNIQKVLRQRKSIKMSYHSANYTSNTNTELITFTTSTLNQKMTNTT